MRRYMARIPAATFFPECRPTVSHGVAGPGHKSGAIELLQEHCTDGRRSGDWLDLAANAVGVTLAALFGILAARKRPKD